MIIKVELTNGTQLNRAVNAASKISNVMKLLHKANKNDAIKTCFVTMKDSHYRLKNGKINKVNQDEYRSVFD